MQAGANESSRERGQGIGGVRYRSSPEIGTTRRIGAAHDVRRGVSGASHSGRGRAVKACMGNLGLLLRLIGKLALGRRDGSC